MREKETKYRWRRRVTKMDFDGFRVNRNRISTVYRRNKLDSSRYIYIYGRGSRRRHTILSVQEFTRSLAIIIASFGITGIGLGQIIIEIFGK